MTKWQYAWDIVLAIAPYLVGLLASLLGLAVYALSIQRKLMRLLGIDNRQRRVIIYLSSLFIPRGCAIDFHGNARSYEGITVPIEEFSASAAIPRILRIDPFENIPSIIRNQLKQRSHYFKAIQFDINASPMRVSDIDFRTKAILTLGSHGYNIVTDYCVTNNLSHLRIINNGTAIQVAKGKNAGEVIRPASNKYDIATLEKLIDETRDDTSIIIAAGLGVIGTMGAINYLLDHWKDLNKAYDDREFALVLQFGPVNSMSFEDFNEGECYP